MKIEILNINNINITFYIGRNSQENFDIIDQADCDDLWFHLNDLPSCHVVASIPSNVKDKINIYVQPRWSGFLKF